MSIDCVGNAPSLWIECFPRPDRDGHKYHRGHAIVLGAPELTGASRLAAHAASRIGAGLVTVLAENNAETYRQSLPPDIMVRDDAGKLSKPSAICGGSGGISKKHRNWILAENNNLPKVLDADLLTQELPLGCLDNHTVLTPHQGEFERVFPDAEQDNRVKAAHAASSKSDCFIVLKGPQTVIAAPDGRIVVNDHASVWLAKAGTGDVLTGMICGLLAQGMPTFEACCAASWMHGEAGIRIGPGLIAGDIAQTLPAILRDLFSA